MNGPQFVSVYTRTLRVRPNGLSVCTILQMTVDNRSLAGKKDGFATLQLGGVLERQVNIEEKKGLL